MPVVNLDYVELAFDKGEKIEIYHDLKKPTTYEPIGNKCIVRENGEIVAVLDRNLNVRYFKDQPAFVSSNRDLLKDATERRIEAPFGIFGLSLESNSKWLVVAKFEERHYKPLIDATNSPLISAFLVSYFWSVGRIGFETVVFRIPTAIDVPNPETLLKLAIVTGVTLIHRYRYKPIDVRTISKTPVRRIVETLEPYVKLPFWSKVPIVWKRGNVEFYSDGQNYVFIKKDRKGRKIDASFCGDVESFCLEATALFERILNARNEVLVR